MSQPSDQLVSQTLSQNYSQPAVSQPILSQTASPSVHQPILGQGAVGANGANPTGAQSIRELVQKSLSSTPMQVGSTAGVNVNSNSINSSSININQTGNSGERGMTPNLNSSDNLFVANLQAVSLEKLVKSKLEVLFQQQRDANIELSGLYDIVLEQVEKPLIELALQSRNGNQVKTAQLLGINRNTLKKKIDTYKIRIRKASSKEQ